MCIPLAALAIGAMAGGAALSAYGATKNAQTAKAQASLNAAQAQQQAELSETNATNILKTAKDNIDLTLAIGGINTSLTRTIADANVGMINATTDFNVGIIKSTTDFNVSSAEGAARLLEARGDMEAGVHRTNADVLEIQAQDTLAAGGQAERQSRAAYANLKGQQRARLAANGVALDEGSALRIQADTDYVSDVDADVIKTNAVKAAFGYRVSAINEQTAAAFATLDGKANALQKRTDAVAARINGQVSAANIALKGATDVLNTKMTATYQIMQSEMDTQVNARNLKQQADADAWAARAQALGYNAQAAQSKLTAKNTNPALIGATSLVNGAAQVATAAAGYYG